MESREVVSLREHFEQRLKDQQAYFERRIVDERRLSDEARQGDKALIHQYQDLADRALKIAETSDQRHFLALNNAGETLKAQNETYATKAETNAIRESINEIKLNYAPLGTLKAVSDKADKAEGKLNNLDGRMAMAAIGLTIIMFVISVGVRFVGG